MRSGFREQFQRLTGLGIIRMAGVSLQALMLVVVGQLAGPQGAGLLQLITAWTCTLGETSALGLPTHAMRRLSGHTGRGAYLRVRQFLTRSISRITLAWLAVISVAAIWLVHGPGLSGPRQGTNLICLALGILAFSLTRFSADSLKALERINTGVLGESSGPPLIALIVIAAVWLIRGELDRSGIVTAFTAGYLISATGLLLIALTHNASTRPATEKTLGGTPIDLDWSNHFPLWVTALVSILSLNYPFLVMPHYAEIEEVGTFAVAFKMLNLVTTILMMMAAIYGPRFARCEAENDAAEAAHLLRQSQFFSLALYLPAMAFMLLTFDHLHPLFGEGFAGGYTFLLILAAGQCINAGAGLSGLILSMMGRGRDEMWSLTLTLLLCMTVTPVIGPAHGAVGIALIYSGGVVVKNCLSYALAIRHLRTMQSHSGHQTAGNPQALPL